MTTFRRLLGLVTLAIYVPFVAAMTEFGHRQGWLFPRTVAVALAVLGLALFAWRLPWARPDRPRASRLSVWLVDTPCYIHWCACLLTFVPAVVGTLFVVAAEMALGRPPRLPMSLYLWTYGTGLVVCAYGNLVRRRWFRVREVDVPVHGLDPAFDGFRVAHLSDLHIGTSAPKSWGQRWARAASARAPDIAVVTGDLISSGTAFHGDVADVVGELRTKDGVFVSLGNHDYFGDTEPLVARLRARGARVLRNDGVLLERAGKRLFLAALDDTWTERDDLDRALASRPEGVPVMLLSHDPECFRQAAAKDVALTLAGHTHGGQIALPFLARWVSFSRLTHHFSLGLYRIGRSTLYVHPGLGTTGPPMRLGVAPAVVILRLRVARPEGARSARRA